MSKKESELVEFLQTGSNDFKEAYYIYKHRKRKLEKDQRKIISWFNRTLMKLQMKHIASNIPFIWEGIKWSNPGIEASKADLIMEQKINHLREINIVKPVI
ncbi:MAG: hypothetical protein IID16_00925 [Candidatus Marinimicrobia bacterium]|nr:hypothetical protein [Candidatus Neomarinimicrobiota bacterium]